LREKIHKNKKPPLKERVVPLSMFVDDGESGQLKRVTKKTAGMSDSTVADTTRRRNGSGQWTTWKKKGKHGDEQE